MRAGVAAGARATASMNTPRRAQTSATPRVFVKTFAQIVRFPRATTTRAPACAPCVPALLL